ncbi:calcium-translocating P-type ATPase, PMCA-type [Acetivibrio mesophilus]|uniref:P-type Ca(2+) transporter n=1 Tax=Acetivibrio mesophilus TaxID=2487273 RepID=A0A4Q0I537_9FIRM|nr:calcium-translocating P-type ATPase, PMCA-type [Acetivibrio mesophilus]ODM27471.1 calcium-translocating P-type ATPase, PMCA-type [Clostridium sp. Bc-iso-3]RXE59430.1 calcium-translocating P-type ATPase, PMCA-type [Acetivibrio mesophilus]HHV30216.1 calcium-translocating P-type ATPase, PMCA-type [Clostridium sp.]
MKHYFESIETVLKQLGSSKNGINPTDATQRLEKYGHNKLDEGKRKTVFAKFLDQLKDPMIIVLIVAAIISGIAGEPADSIIILMVVVVNSILGVVQEGKAEKAIEALQKMSSPYSKVRRNGQVMQIKSDEIVPGDIVLIEAGDAVPADMRIIEASSLKIEEASLTGESVPTEKDADAIPPSDKDISLGDRRNMAYMGTNVVYGRGEGVVVSTGMSTEMGKIANIISNTNEEKTPLQKKLAGLSKVLSVGVLGICIFIFVFGVLRSGGFSGDNVLDTFLLAISLAVAAIPEGLVAVVTVVLSIGVTKMSKRNSIIRKLTAVETLGCTQIICSDKTGTLTQNKMTVVDSFGDVQKLAVSMALCNDANISGENGEVIGEPTESSLVRYAFDMGINKTEMEKKMPRVAEAPFDSVRKMMSTVHKTEGGKFVQYTKGAPDELLKNCTHILTKDGVVPLTDKHRTEILSENKKMANKALRVLASAMKETDSLPADTSPESLERDLTFIGLAGMIDPVRPEVKAAIEKCRQAGIRPIMITGDHKDTAVAIAKELGIISDESQAITGAELSEISDIDFEEKVKNYSVYARVQPEHKVRIVNAWRNRGKITAMTGDGVNDAPALKSADIGVGMGITGTDVTKNVSDMVLADDNFASIVYAVEEGRRIYDNIRKSIQFLLSSNLSEVIALFIATLQGFILFSPIHILWINLVTDTLPAIALGMEEAEEDIMKRPPRSTKEGIFANGLGINIIYQGIAIAALTLISYFIGNTQSHIIGMTMAFLTMSTCEVFQSLNLRSMTKSIFRLKTHNKVLFGAMVLAFALSLFVIYVPGVNNIFKLTPLSGSNFLISIGLAFAIIPIVELVKLIAFAVKKA